MTPFQVLGGIGIGWYWVKYSFSWPLIYCDNLVFNGLYESIYLGGYETNNTFGISPFNSP